MIAHEQMASPAEGADGGVLDGELPEHPDVVDEQVHKPELVQEARQDVEPRGVEGDGGDVLLELLGQLHLQGEVVPNADGAVDAASHH